MTPTFTDEPNGRTIMGERCHVSECKRFRIIEIYGAGFWAHSRRVLRDEWSGIAGMPFDSLTSAIIACSLVVFSKTKKKTRQEYINEDAG